MNVGKNTSKKISENAIRRLLKAHNCQVALYEVKTRFLGNIASPSPAVSPIQVLKGLWGGELPEFEDEASVQELFDILINGLWNRLTRHQNHKNPFHLTRLSRPTDHASVKRYLTVRLAELDGFVTGLYGEEEAVHLSERAHEALENLGNIRSFLAGFSQFPDEGDPAKTGAHLVELTKIAEQEINALILACTESRRSALDKKSLPKPTLH